MFGLFATIFGLGAARSAPRSSSASPPETEAHKNPWDVSLDEVAKTDDYRSALGQLGAAIGGQPRPGEALLSNNLNEQIRMAQMQQQMASVLTVVSTAGIGTMPWWGQSQQWTMPHDPMPENDAFTATYDARGRLHNERGPAVVSKAVKLEVVLEGVSAIASEYLENKTIRTRTVPVFQRWFWHGVEVPEKVIVSPESITVSEIILEPNLEIRRVAIERFGQDRFFRECGATLIAKDEYGELYVRTFRSGTARNPVVRADPWGVESLVFVKVRNSTPEPDGTFKDYYLRVPPETLTPRDGIAWSFGVRPHDYNPKVQT